MTFFTRFCQSKSNIQPKPGYGKSTCATQSQTTGRAAIYAEVAKRDILGFAIFKPVQLC